MLLKQIEYLQAVIEEGSFHAAAERCHVSQSAISQQIKKLEDDLDVRLLMRHNRTFSLTKAGEHFYYKSLLIRSDLKKLIQETKQIDKKDEFVLRLGYYLSYHGDEFSQAIAAFSKEYPTIKINTISGSHEDLYSMLRNDQLDLILNDQRRAFSEEYNNLILAKSTLQIEISNHNPLSTLKSLSPAELKNMPCILVAKNSQQDEEHTYYDEVVGLHGNYIFTETIQDAQLKIITGQGYLPVDVIQNEPWSNTTISRIPLLRNGKPITKAYCAFWKQNNSGFYIEKFAELLKKQF